MIKVAVWGTGMMGQGLLGFILDRPNDAELVGAIVTNPAKEGKTVGELLGRTCDVCMTTDVAAVLAKKPDVVCICTQSNLHEVSDQIEACVRAGANVLCIAEKLAYPWASDADWAERFEQLAMEHDVSILGTGINPGFILDALVVAWTSICLKIDRIEAERVNDLSPFRNRNDADPRRKPAEAESGSDRIWRRPGNRATRTIAFRPAKKAGNTNS